MTTAHDAPATEAPANLLEFAKLAENRKVLRKAKRSYPDRKDHGFVYVAADAADHLDPEVQRICWEARMLSPQPTKKEIQFALGMHTPKDVTDAADRHGVRIGSDAHLIPVEKRPGLGQVRKAPAFGADAISVAVKEAGLSDRSLAKLLKALATPAQAEVA